MFLRKRNVLWGKNSSELPLRSSRTQMHFKIGRSSYRRSSVKKGVLRNFAKFIGKDLCQSLFFNKVAGLRYLPVNFVKLLRTPFLRNTSGRLFRWKFLNVRKKHLCSSIFLIKLRAWRPAFLLKNLFLCEYCKIFKNNLLVEHFLFIILLCNDRILWTSLGTKLTSFIFLAFFY